MRRDQPAGRAVGQVTLVGAGPGAPDLITQRGAAALAAADVVVYDALAARELLDLAPASAERIDVGRRGHDEPVRTQADINALLVARARAGHSVVRLKGGDPFVFGRGGEEATACVEAGIPFRVVPGVSSAIGALAYAGIPITDRRHSASFGVVTGHKDPTRVSEQTRWAELAGATDTLVILMGMRNLASLISRLIEGGRSPRTPAAAIMNGTLPSQIVVEAPLAELANAVEAAGLQAPAVVVIGEVVSLRQTLSWFDTRPLFGRRVLVTRASDQADGIVAALRDAGAEPVLIPMIETRPSDPQVVDAALRRIAEYDAVVFTSANAVRYFDEFARCGGVSVADAGPAIACVGPRTADAARERGWRVDLMPAERFDAAGLLDAIRSRWPGPNRRFLLPQAEAASELLRDGLRREGAIADAVPVYRTVAPDIDATALRASLTEGAFDVLTFTSPSTVENFVAALDAAAMRAARNCQVAAIGPVTANALRRVGLDPDFVSDRATIADLVHALAAAPQRSGPTAGEEER